MIKKIYTKLEKQCMRKMTSSEKGKERKKGRKIVEPLSESSRVAKIQALAIVLNTVVQTSHRSIYFIYILIS
jgi:hypothetical protein